MYSIFPLLFPEDLFTVPYKDQEEYLEDLTKKCELILTYYLVCKDNGGERLDKFGSEILTDEEIQKVFKQNNTILENRDSIRREISKSTFFISSRLKNTRLGEEKFFAFEYIRVSYQLSDIECFCLILSLLAKIDGKYEKIFAFLQDDASKKIPSYDLAFKLYFFVEKTSDIENYYQMKSTLETKMSDLCFNGDAMDLNNRLLSFLLSNGSSPISMRGVSSFIPREDEPLLIMEDTANKLAKIAGETMKETTVIFYLHGCRGIGKKTQVKRFAEVMNTSVSMIDMASIDTNNEESFYTIIMTACREAIINQGTVCFCNFDVLLKEDEDNSREIEFVLGIASRFSDVIFLLSNKDKHGQLFLSDKFWIDVPMRYPSKSESIILWDAGLKELRLENPIPAFEMANKFSFTPGQITGTIEEAKKLYLWNDNVPLSRQDICQSAYTQIIHDLEKHATLIYAKHTWDQLILADEQKHMLRDACNQIKYKHIVYDEWGFEKRLAYGRGVSMLFAGPPGTGKTMAAQVVASELGIEIYKVDLSQIVSKYIGETEKNLNELFAEAKKTSVILFFDETDALLGKRTEVKDSHDKNANLETSYLLQKMEEYDGITIMSTNYLENIDTAFFRRISYVIHFPFPDVKSRKMIWQNMYPKEVPLSEDIDFDYLAQQFEISGGNIKNIAVTSSFLAATLGEKVDMRHIVKAIKYEITKQGKLLIKEDFGEHGYLLK